MNGLILRQFQEKGFKARFMAGEACANESIARIAQNASEGLLVTVPKEFDCAPSVPGGWREVNPMSR
ncbi:hypothetical protein ACFVXG_27595 [Kitasatospora sp. NPDC058162]|uniref:hypothetical protein n=1 Tax=Kitasatospora sp. NPDC058162 TaxID=3346362 RepID=UPI0036DA115E